MNIINSRHKNDGFGTISKPEPFLRQDYQQLRQYCLIKQVRFIDEMFPPDRKSIGKGVLNPADLAKVVWLRPSVSVFVAKNCMNPCHTNVVG